MNAPRLILSFLGALWLSACNGNADKSPVSEGEAAALDEAAKMLDEKRLPEGALPEIDPPAPEAAETPPE